jgi:hypothetical protein
MTNLYEQIKMVNKKLEKLAALGEDANPMSIEHWENVKLNLEVEFRKQLKKDTIEDLENTYSQLSDKWKEHFQYDYEDRFETSLGNLELVIENMANRIG